ncbi:MAG: gamma-glutamyl-gamma-aminobutyrate hydrolase family protein [Lentisphaerae bacterium]|nr:gamma-glutamyl-gamma-aminobutyrate hydrolase family protein [Lentisphaerota bacterium]
MPRWLITQRLERNRHQDVIDVLERAYLDFFAPRVGSVVPVSNHAAASLQAQDYDGLIVTGGGEVPREFMEGNAGTTPADMLESEKYALQARFVTEALRAGKPIIAICYGFQLMNVLLGGRVTWGVHGGAPDRQPGRPHPALLTATPWFRPQSQATVNSYHNQGITPLQLAADLAEVARDDAYPVVEAAAHRSKPVLCLQWHPERPAPDPNFNAALIAAFLRSIS